MASPEPTDEQLARLVVRVLLALVALLLAGGVAAASTRLAAGDDARGSEGVDEPAVVGAAGSLADGIGPLPVSSVSSYVGARERALAAVGDGDERAAVVSFSAYRSVADALDAVAGVDAEAVLLALPGGRPTAVSADVEPDEVVADQRASAAAEKKALEQLLPTVTDDDFKRQYQADIDRLGALLAAPKDIGPIVHAVVVVGDGRALRRLAAQTGVRLVDVGRSMDVPSTVAGLRPEETVRAGVPAVRPA